MNRSKIVTTLPAIALLVGCTTVLAANESTPAKLISSWPDRPTTALEGTRKEGWAILSLIINTSGEISELNVIEQSDVKHDKDRLIRLYAMRRYQPAQRSGRNVDSAIVITHFSNKLANGDNNMVQRGFKRATTEFNLAMRKKDFDAASSFLLEMDEYALNNVEQAFNHFYHAQYFYVKNDIPQYKKHLLSAYALQSKLPTELRIHVLQNTLSWYMFTQQYLFALDVINNYGSLKDVNMDDKLIESAKQQLAKELEANPELHYSYTLEPNKPQLLGLSRYSIQIKTQAPLEKAQLRCRYGVLDVPKVSENRYAITQTEANVRCGLLIKSETEQSIEIEQTGQAIRL